MKTIVTSTRIPVDQANGSYNILLPQNFGQPRGFLVYAMPYSVQPNNFDSTTNFPCISVGFGGSNNAGTGLTNACAWVSNQDGADPTSARASFGNTVSVFSTNINSTVNRQWQMTGFGENIIFGTYQSQGTQVEPLDVVFTVFGGNDFFCAVGQTALPAAINTPVNVATTFRPDAILFSHARPAQTTDGQITFAATTRNVATGGTTILSTNATMWRNQDAQGSSVIQARNNVDSGTTNFATASSVRFQYMYSSGFSVTQSTANSGNSIIFLAMKAGSALTEDTIPRFFVQQAGSGLTNGTYNSGFPGCHVLGPYSFNNSANTTHTTNGAGQSVDSISFYTGNGLTKQLSVGIGTFTSSTSSTTVTGVGTSFLQQLGAIDTIYNQNEQLVGIVSSITSNTSLLLQSNAAITATGSSFYFEKPRQFSMSYGLPPNDGNGNASFRGYFSDSALISFNAATQVISIDGKLQDLGCYVYGRSSRNRSFNFSTGPLNGTQGGWFFSILDENYHIRRGSIS